MRRREGKIAERRGYRMVRGSNGEVAATSDLALRQVLVRHRRRLPVTSLPHWLRKK